MCGSRSRKAITVNAPTAIQIACGDAFSLLIATGQRIP